MTDTCQACLSRGGDYLAKQVGVTIPSDFKDINCKLTELATQGGDHEAEQELLGRLDEIEYREGLEALERTRLRG